MSTNLSIIIPAYNEKINFEKKALHQVSKYLKEKKLNWEVIIVDDGSTDDSVKLIADFIKNKPNWKLIRNSHQGKSATIATGVAQAKYPHVLFTDFDQATPIGEVNKLIPFLNKNYPIIIGSREVKGSLRQKEPPLRHLMGKVFNLAVQVIAVRGIHDTQCGFKLFETKTALKLFKALRVYQPKSEKHAFTGAFDVELLFIANKWGIKVAEVPVHWYHAPTDRVNPLRDSIRMFIDLLRIRFQSLLGHYNKS